MTLVVGIDEAGYGPNLGPLVVAATAWRVAAAPEEIEAHLMQAMAAVAAVGDAASPPQWADSKQVYRGAAGFAALERAALVGVAACGNAIPASWTMLEGTVGPISPDGGCRGQWRDLEAVGLPMEASAPRCLTDAAAVRGALARHGVAVERIACRVLYPDAFNRQLDLGHNKSDILSAATLELAAGLARSTVGPEAVTVWCDRHGGRKRYGGLVARHFDEPLVRALEETPLRSAYLLPGGADGRACRIEFSVGGESRLPVALASVTAKYVRELAMHAFNAFWSTRAPGLRPTAGYPTDAARWRRDATAAIAHAGISEDELWRRA